MKNIQSAATGAQTLDTQTVEGSEAPTPVTAEGTTSLSCFATDYAGNVEAAKTQAVRIDRTAPGITGGAAAGCLVWPPDNTLVKVAPSRAPASCRASPRWM